MPPFYRCASGGRRTATLELVSHTVRTVIGIFLLVLAAIGAVLPLLQGWIFFGAAVAVLGTDHVITRWCFRQMERGKQWVLQVRKKKDPEPKL